MISAVDALALGQSRAIEPAPLGDLTEREEIQLDYLDAKIEGDLYRTYRGGAWGSRLPVGLVELHVLNHLRSRYEDGGWFVGIFPQRTGDDVTEFLLVFSPKGDLKQGDKPVIAPEPWPPKAMPSTILLKAQEMILPPARYRLHVRMPTRQRPAQALAALERYRTMAGCPVTLEVVLDEDDTSMLNAEVMLRLARLGVTITVGKHGSKVEACNAGQVTGWDILVLASDDMIPVVDGYGGRILSAMEQHFPHLDGAVFFNDGYQRKHLCTLPIQGRRLYEQFGHVYEPAYRSLFCDREQTDILEAMGRLVYIDEKIIEHRHHAWGRTEKDELYKRNDALEDADKAVYEQRKSATRERAQWAFDAPPLWLSLLICTVPERQAELGWLIDHLYRQILKDAPREVEILVDGRVKPTTVGEKRQALLERAKGHFVAFIDDDDGVAHDFIRRVVTALKSDPAADCASLEGIITSAGGHPERFRHSLAFDGWYTKDGVHYRTPNHLSPVRRELALRVGFVPQNVGEDHDYSKRLLPLLKKEVSTGSEPWYWYWYDPSHSVQQAGR